jgi:hypothetical protein
MILRDLAAKSSASGTGRLQRLVRPPKVVHLIDSPDFSTLIFTQASLSKGPAHLGLTWS